MQHFKTISQYVKILWLPLFVGINLSACHPKEEHEDKKASGPPPVLTVSAYQIKPRPLKKSMTATGAIYARDLVTIQPAVTGLKVLKVYVDEGDYVQAGQLLATLDSRLLRSQLSTARNRLNSSRYQYSKTQKPLRPQEIARLRAAVAQAQVAVNDAANNERRTANLFNQSVATHAELDARRSALANAQTVLQQQQEALNLALAGARTEDLQMSKLGVADAQAQIDQLNIQLEQTEIRSPSAGLILSKDVNEGEISSFNSPYFTLIKNGQLEFRGQIPEADLQRVPIGATVQLISDANPSLKASAVVRRLGSAVDPTTRLGTAIGDVLPGSQLRVGQFVRAVLTVTQTQNIVVPLKSVLNRANVSQVFVLENNRAKARTITLGHQTDKWIEVLSGLKLNEKIIEDGVGFLKDGDPVKVVPSPPERVL